MFEGSLVESNHLLRTNNRWTTAISLTVQLAVVGTLVALPLLHPEALPFSAPRISLVAPPPQAPPPPQRMRVVTAAVGPQVPLLIERAPVIHQPTDPGGPPPDAGTQFTSFSNSLHDGAQLAFGNSGPHVVARAESPTGGGGVHVGPVRVSQGVAQGLLLVPLRPIYPQIAVATRTQGTVVVHALISKNGTVESLQVLSGPAMLQNAALQAIREARYSPYKLNGEPVEVETTFNVNFRLGEQ